MACAGVQDFEPPTERKAEGGREMSLHSSLTDNHGSGFSHQRSASDARRQLRFSLMMLAVLAIAAAVLAFASHADQDARPVPASLGKFFNRVTP
jgi:hypothetical protein